MRNMALQVAALAAEGHPMNLADLFSPDQPLLEMVIRGSAI